MKLVEECEAFKEKLKHLEMDNEKIQINSQKVDVLKPIIPYICLQTLKIFQKTLTL